jgi:hypothetical protein
MKINRCFYQIFGGFADWFDRFRYNCPRCVSDSLNRQCKYYCPVTVILLDVGSAAAEASAGHSERNISAGLP